MSKIYKTGTCTTCGRDDLIAGCTHANCGGFIVADIVPVTKIYCGGQTWGWARTNWASKKTTKFFNRDGRMYQVDTRHLLEGHK